MESEISDLEEALQTPQELLDSLVPQVQESKWSWIIPERS